MIYQGTQNFTRAWARMGPGVATPLHGREPSLVPSLFFALCVKNRLGTRLQGAILGNLFKTLILLVNNYTPLYTRMRRCPDNTLT